MSLKGEGVLAIWHDIEDEGRKLFYDWHGNEHMPERLSIDGFIRGRRFFSIESETMFFNVYETTKYNILESKDYLDKLNNPSAYTKNVITFFRKVTRILCRVKAHYGFCDGSLICTITTQNKNIENYLLSNITYENLFFFVKKYSFASAYLLKTDIDACNIITNERNLRPEDSYLPISTLIIEGWQNTDDFINECKSFLSKIIFINEFDEKLIKIGFYKQQILIT